MSSLNLVSNAIAAAIAIAQPLPTAQQYANSEHILIYQELASEVDIAELTNRVFMAERVLLAFYQLASLRNDLFKQFTSTEWMNLFKESASLLFSTKQYAQEGSELFNILIRFEDTLNQVTRLFKAYEHKQKSDEIVLRRLYRGEQDVGMRFDGTLSRDEKRQKLLAVRRSK